MARIFIILLFTLALSIVSNQSYAGRGLDRLQTFFTDVKTIQANFSQTVLDAQLKTIQSTAGTMKLERPGKFRWDYSKPFVQQIIGDGKKVWLYDRDLEQVTVKSMGGALGNTPALLLSGTEPLNNNFFINELGAEIDSNEDRDWVELLPKNTDAGFDRMVLIFEKDGLKAMELRDGLGQNTRLVFTDIKLNIQIDAAQFTFVPPKGIDIIGEESLIKQ